MALARRSAYLMLTQALTGSVHIGTMHGIWSGGILSRGPRCPRVVVLRSVSGCSDDDARFSRFLGWRLGDQPCSLIVKRPARKFQGVNLNLSASVQFLLEKFG
ncbi:hypothetical protein EDB85DRAFT_2027430, partial [Lactarius pseudohatsudake]